MLPLSLPSDLCSTISQLAHSQYVIPGEHESLVPGERRFNWVWYVNYNQTTELPHSHGSE